MQKCVVSSRKPDMQSAEFSARKPTGIVPVKALGEGLAQFEKPFENVALIGQTSDSSARNFGIRRNNLEKLRKWKNEDALRQALDTVIIGIGAVCVILAQTP